MANRILIVDDLAFMRMMIRDILVKTDSRLWEKHRTVRKQSRNLKNFVQI